MIWLLVGALLGALAYGWYSASVSLPPRDRILNAIRLGYHYGLEIGRAACLSNGSLYVYLTDLEDAGVIRGEWQDLEPGREYRRRLYYLTETT